MARDERSETSRHLEWVVPSFKERSYELREGDELVARLEFAPLPSFSWEFTNPRMAHASRGDERWQLTVSRSGFSGMLGATALVKIAGSNRGEVSLTRALSRGELRLDGKRTLQWQGKLTRDATSIFSLDDAESTPLVKFRTGSPMDRVTTRVEVTPRGQDVNEWPLLCALGYYLRMLMGRVWR